MALRLVVLLAMACLCMAQPTMPEATTPEPTTPEATTPEATMPEVTTPDVTTPEVTTPMTTPPPEVIDPIGMIQEQVNAEYDLSIRYRFRQSYDFRRINHFFCAEQGVPFVTDEPDVDNSGGVIHNWSLFLQYPILAYLDTMKKGALINQIIAIINAGNYAGVSTDNLCIGRVEHYDVSLYTESVLINFYLVDTVIGMNDDRVAMINTAFRDGIAIENRTLLQEFQGQQAIVISNSTYGEINSNVHPGAFDIEGQRFPETEDPTLRAIILGYWARQTSLEDFVTNRDYNASITSRFAINPNPVFYGLTAGDYVFIVIGTVLCTLLAFIMVFGFCIQPFLM